MMKNKRLFVCYGVTILISLGIALWGTIFLTPGDELGYSLLNYYIIFPLTALIMGCVLGIRKTRLQWPYILLVGLLGFLMPLWVFGITSLVTTLLGMGSSLLGISIGMLIHFLCSRKQK